MSHQRLLVCIILTYNNEDTVERCIKSILNQKTDYDYEIRLYDDCSTDNSFLIYNKYQRLYPDKFKVTIQKENSFLKKYNKTQAYQAFQELNSKYFCIIEGDDYWCNPNKIQMALDFLENNPDYMGWAHDTYQFYENTGEYESWVHDKAQYDMPDTVFFSENMFFLMTSSRIFRNIDFKKLKIWPVDYLIYNFHLAKGPIRFYDQKMAVYTVGSSGTFSTLQTEITADMNAMFPFRISRILNFKFDDICTSMQKYYENCWGRGDKYYNELLKAKKNFGVRLGWFLWFCKRFIPKYGLECMNLNYVYPRGKVKNASNKKIFEDKFSFLKKSIERIADHGAVTLQTDTAKQYFCYLFERMQHLCSAYSEDEYFMKFVDECENKYALPENYKIIISKK